MKLYNEDNPAPNPRRVRIYLAEKNLTLPLVPIAMRRREHKAPEFVAKNSLGQVPMLELDDGTCISESVAICRYLEDLNPTPPLFGSTALEKALVEMWIRRMEFQIWRPIGMVWRHADPRTAFLGGQFPEFGAANRAQSFAAMGWLDQELSDGRTYLAGSFYSMADIVGLCGLDFGAFIGLELPDDCPHLLAWHARISARPSAAA
jgi:glutathione S-transferase